MVELIEGVFCKKCRAKIYIKQDRPDFYFREHEGVLSKSYFYCENNCYYDELILYAGGGYDLINFDEKVSNSI